MKVVQLSGSATEEKSGREDHFRNKEQRCGDSAEIRIRIRSEITKTLQLTHNTWKGTAACIDTSKKCNFLHYKQRQEKATSPSARFYSQIQRLEKEETHFSLETGLQRIAVGPGF